MYLLDHSTFSKKKLTSSRAVHSQVSLRCDNYDRWMGLVPSQKNPSQDRQSFSSLSLGIPEAVGVSFSESTPHFILPASPALVALPFGGTLAE